MEKKVISTPLAGSPIGPYNQAIVVGNFVFVSGQIAINSETNTLVLDTIENETHQVLRNLKNILIAAGFTLEDIVKTSIFLKNMQDFVKVNEVYGSYFEKNYPARETVEVSRLPKDVNIEISVIAYRA